MIELPRGKALSPAFTSQDIIAQLVYEHTAVDQMVVQRLVPYTKGLCESYKSICSKYGVQAYFKGGTH